MISEKVLGAYASVGSLSPSEQAGWYRKAATEWNIKTFEVPLFPGQPLSSELVEVFSDTGASIVGTMVALWAGKGQADPAYGLASTVERARRQARLDAQAVLQQCLDLSAKGVGVKVLAVHTGQRTGGVIEHGIALHRSLSELGKAAQKAKDKAKEALAKGKEGVDEYRANRERRASAARLERAEQAVAAREAGGTVPKAVLSSTSKVCVMQ